MKSQFKQYRSTVVSAEQALSRSRRNGNVGMFVVEGFHETPHYGVGKGYWVEVSSHNSEDEANKKCAKLIRKFEKDNKK